MKPTIAQLSLWHVLQSALIAALVSILTTIAQYLSVGDVHWQVLLTVLGAAFLGALGVIYKSLSSSPYLGQAVLDTVQEVEQELPWMKNSATTRTTNAAVPPAVQKPIVFPPTPQ